MHIVRALALAATTLLASPTAAQQPSVELSDLQKRALDGYQRETLTCANYFMLVQRCLTNSSAPATMILSARNAADELILAGLGIGQAIGLSQETMEARMKAKGDAVMALVGGGDCGQLEAASDRYLERCTYVAGNGPTVMGEYLKAAGAE